MAERSSTPEPFDCKTPPNKIDETLPMLEPAVFTFDPQDVEEDLEYINEHNLNSAMFWRGVCSQYHQTFLEIHAEVNEAKNKTNDLILNLTPENVTQHSRIVTTTRKGSSTPTKMSKLIGRQIH